MARQATLHCGNDSIEWAKVADAIILLEKFGGDGTIGRYLRSIQTKPNVVRIANISSLPAYRLVQNTTGMARGGSERGRKIWRYTLEELVSFLAAFKATRLHDTLHAIIGLSSDFTPKSAFTTKSDTASASPTPNSKQGLTPFEIDYSKPALVIFKRFLHAAIKKSKSLDIICRPWAPRVGEDVGSDKEVTIELPSWIASLERKPYQATKDGDMVRHNPDPLVGPAVMRNIFYTASKSEPMDFEIPEIENPQSKRLIVEGFVLGKIGKTWGCGTFGNVPYQWLQAGGWTDERATPPEELWRTLVGDRNQNGGDPDRWYPRVFQSAIQERGISYGFETYRLINESTNATIRELFTRVQAVVWNRRLVRINGSFVGWRRDSQDSADAGRGALGLAPSEAQEGDLVCIIFGCSVPLVLREHSQPDSAVTSDSPSSEPREGAPPPASAPPGHQANGTTEAAPLGAPQGHQANGTMEIAPSGAPPTSAPSGDQANGTTEAASQATTSSDHQTNGDTEDVPPTSSSADGHVNENTGGPPPTLNSSGGAVNGSTDGAPQAFNSSNHQVNRNAQESSPALNPSPQQVDGNTEGTLPTSNPPNSEVNGNLESGYTLIGECYVDHMMMVKRFRSSKRTIFRGGNSDLIGSYESDLYYHSTHALQKNRYLVKYWVKLTTAVYFW